MPTTERIVAVIPARLGSKRVKAKNLRMLRGKPMIYYCIRAVLESRCFTARYVNSESERIGMVAARYGIDFYKRPAALASDESMIDEYIHEFLCNVPCDILAVVSPTSPFLTSKTIEDAIEKFRDSDYDTMLCCEDVRTHCFLQGKAINFSTAGQHPRSQDIPSIQALNFAVTVWRSAAFVEQYERLGHAVYTGRLGFFSIHGLEAIDVDWEQDFALAELAMEHRERLGTRPAEYDAVLDS